MLIRKNTDQASGKLRLRLQRAVCLLAVCLLSAIRGYTQGQGQMLPTAVSQVVESAGKLVVGLGLTWYLLTVRGVSPEIGAAGAMAGVTVGSLLALLVLTLRWLPSCMGSDTPPSRREVLGQLLKIGIPITLGAGGMSFITLLDQCYWVASAGLGAVVGSVLPFSTEGVDFVMTAMFTVIFLNQWEKDRQHYSALIGLAAPLACLVFFGSGSFLLPSMGCILILLLALRKPIEKAEGTEAEKSGEEVGA